MSGLYIPKTITIGFQKREDTYTGKLGYVIYHNDKNILCKEKSWNGWRDKTLGEVTFDNVPIEGFVFNKGVQRGGYWHSNGRSVFRVYDSRDFEFEISAENVMQLLMHTDVSKRDIQEKCILAWAGQELVLLPINSQAYLDAVAHTEKQTKTVSAKNLVLGATYSLKKSTKLVVYMGYHTWYQNEYDYQPDKITVTQEDKGKKHIFRVQDEHYPSFDTLAITALAECVDESSHPQYAEFAVELDSTMHVKQIKGLALAGDIDTSFREYSACMQLDDLNFMKIKWSSWFGKDEPNDIFLRHDTFQLISIDSADKFKYDMKTLNTNYHFKGVYNQHNPKIKMSITKALAEIGITDVITKKPQLQKEVFFDKLNTLGYKQELRYTDEQGNILKEGI